MVFLCKMHKKVGGGGGSCIVPIDELNSMMYN